MHRAIAVLALLPFCLGCPKRIDFGRTGEVTDPARLLALTAAAEGRISGIKGEARLTADLPQGKGTVTLFIAAARPGLLHFESLDFFGKPQAVLVTDGKSFYLYQEGRYYRGPATAANVARAFPLALPPEQLVGLLLGQAPRIEPEKVTMKTDPGSNAYVLTLMRGPVSQTLWIHPQHHRVLRSVVQGPGGYEVSFEDMQQTGSLVFPRQIAVEARAEKVRLELRYTDVALNEAPDLSLFSTEAPEGVPVIEVGEDGQPRPAS